MAGALDGLVGYAGIDQRVEIKDGDKPASGQQLTDAESEVFSEWRGRRPVVLTSIDDVIDLLQQMRRESNAISSLKKNRG